jgi:hypothetical protein
MWYSIMQTPEKFLIKVLASFLSHIISAKLDNNFFARSYVLHVARQYQAKVAIGQASKRICLQRYRWWVRIFSLAYVSEIIS